MSYDNVGRVSERRFADGYKIKYSYDALSRVSKVEGSDGRTVSYEYDAMGRAAKVEDGRSVEFAYNKLNQLNEINDWLGKTTLENDILGRLTMGIIYIKLLLQGQIHTEEALHLRMLKMLFKMESKLCRRMVIFRMFLAKIITNPRGDDVTVMTK